MSAAIVADDREDARLLANVRPAGWVNPDPAPRYNLVVIGGGTAGLVSAAGAAGLGARVALVERDLLGGDCLNAGCVPSKALLRCARAAAHIRDANTFGVRVAEGWHVDFPAVMARMRRLRAGLSQHDSASRFRNMGVDVFLGEAAFAGRDAVSVGKSQLRFARAVIATGSRPHVPPIPGLAETGFLTNETVFALAELPRRLAVIGGGPVGCELAQAFARFGAEVIVVTHGPQILPKEEPAAAGIVSDSFARDGVKVLLDSEVNRVEHRRGDKELIVRTGHGTEEVLADAILVAAGRVPNV
ncbi:MAG TPA: FAD-dependent oxidoreductase, partial [Gemmata sp.]|nr:FAD-dependent oxidoreductase [Gemmata sp.]